MRSFAALTAACRRGIGTLHSRPPEPAAWPCNGRDLIRLRSVGKTTTSASMAGEHPELNGGLGPCCCARLANIERLLTNKSPPKPKRCASRPMPCNRGSQCGDATRADRRPVKELDEHGHRCPRRCLESCTIPTVGLCLDALATGRLRCATDAGGSRQ